MEIIAVQPAEDIAGGTSKTFVDRCGLASILFGTPETQLRVLFLENFNRLVGAPSVEDRELQIRIPLFEDTPNRFLKEMTLIIRRRDH